MNATHHNFQANAQWIDCYRDQIDVALAAACDFGDGCPERLSEAMRYALLAPGKRLRPLLVLMAAEACVGQPSTPRKQGIDVAMPGAVAVEMIHAYSLIHDDLPAMDDDDLRRGRPTVHVEFDEATAILAGDALLAEAFRHLAHQVDDPKVAVEAIRTLSEAASAAQLVGGQADDLMAENDPMTDQLRIGTDRKLHLTDAGDPQDQATSVISSEQTVLLSRLESIHQRKTGALIGASLDLGAILVGGNQEARSALRRYASVLGLAFQVVDDNLDFTADTETLGKRAGKDADRGKLTYPGLLGIKESKAKAKRLIEQSKREAAFFGASADRMLWLADYVLERTH